MENDNKKFITDKAKKKVGGIQAETINAADIVTGVQIAVGDSNIVAGNSNIISQVGGNISIGKKRDDLPTVSGDQAFERIGAAVRLNLSQLESNIKQARTESNQFFKLTLLFSGLGFLVILGGVIFLLLGQTTAGIVTTVASLIPEVTAGLFYSKDRELRKTVQAYHQHMLESQKLLTMIDVSETIIDQVERDRMKQEIIFKVLAINSPVGQNTNSEQITKYREN